MLVPLYQLATFVPALALNLRRMHDVGKSGWFMLIPIYSLVLFCRDSEPDNNRYGPHPSGGRKVHSLPAAELHDAKKNAA